MATLTAEQIEQKKQQLKQLSDEMNAIVKELQERQAHRSSTKPTSTMPQVVRVNIKLPSHFTSFQKTNLEWDDCLNRSLGSDPVITAPSQRACRKK